MEYVGRRYYTTGVAETLFNGISVRKNAARSVEVWRDGPKKTTITGRHSFGALWVEEHPPAKLALVSGPLWRKSRAMDGRL